MISAEQIIMGFIEDMNMSESPSRKHIRWVRQALDEIGYYPTSSSLSTNIPIVNRMARKPVDYRHAIDVFLCKDGRKQEAYCTSIPDTYKLPKEGLCCSFYHQPDTIMGAVVIEESPSSFVIPVDGFESIDIRYVGPATDERGFPLVPIAAESAVYAYLIWKQYAGIRASQGNIPQSQVNQSRAEWSEMCGSAKGRLAMPSKTDMDLMSTTRRGRRVSGSKLPRK
jgi:hypothetical protein